MHKKMLLVALVGGVSFFGLHAMESGCEELANTIWSDFQDYLGNGDKDPQSGPWKVFLENIEQKIDATVGSDLTLLGNFRGCFTTRFLEGMKEALPFKENEGLFYDQLNQAVNGVVQKKCKEIDAYCQSELDKLAKSQLAAKNFRSRLVFLGKACLITTGLILFAGFCVFYHKYSGQQKKPFFVRTPLG